MHSSRDVGKISAATQTAEKLLGALETVIKGRNDTLRLVVAALLADGHVLLEDYPGSGKTTLAKTLGRLIESDLAGSDLKPFRRIQFTPDLLPGDVLGVNVFEPKTAEFTFQPGPVFAHIVLADEINRTGPKVQAAFLECMAEKQVTLDNTTHPLDELFFVIGTQNPLDLAGTYPLPQVQLDRFLFKIPMSYVDAETEAQILAEHENIKSQSDNIDSVCSRSDILAAREALQEVEVSPLIQNAIVSISQKSRQSNSFQHGLSTRAALMLQQALKAWAIVSGRDYITEDDFKFLVPYVFAHRLQSAGGVSSTHEGLEQISKPVIDELIHQGIKH